MEHDEAADAPMQVRETHIGGVVLVGSRAWKFKKPLDLGFADFSSASARLHACEREIALNSRFAPDVYLGLATLDLPGMVHEPLVAMRRLPDSHTLTQLVRRHEDADDALRGIARTLAEVHSRSLRTAVIDECAGAAALHARWRNNLAETRLIPRSGLAVAEIDEIAALVDSYIEGRRDLFARRAREGCAVDGHGDLTADDIFCMPDGPRLLDCLEFDDRLRFVDRMDDACFLAMDLERLGSPNLARRFIDLYREFTADSAPQSLVDHYIAYRAMVRAKVAAIRAMQGDASARAQARHLLELTRAHLDDSETVLTLVGGGPGTGKSTLARGIADRLGQVLISSDRVRKELSGMDPRDAGGAGFRQGLYSAASTTATYGEMVRRAGSLLRSGESVVLDATWSDAGLRREARHAATQAHARVVELRCHVPREVADRRIVERGRQEMSEARSDADPDIAAAIDVAFAAWRRAVTIETSADPTDCVARASLMVRPGGLGPTRPHLPLMSPD